MLLRATATALALSAIITAPAAIAKPGHPAPAVQAHHAGKLHQFKSDDNGFATNSFYYDTGKEVIVFDAQFTAGYAEQLLKDIRNHTKSPITTVVVTHPNPDKFNGAAVFQKLGAKVVASEATAAAIPGVHAYKKYYFVNMAKAFTEATYPAQATVDVTFRNQLSLANGAVELRVLKHAGVASTQTVAYIPGAKALVVGDLVHHKAHAWLEGGIVNGKPQIDLQAWKQALAELKSYAGATVYGGRGDAAPVGAVVQEQTAYMDRVEAITRAYIKGLGARRAELSGPDAAKHHAAIAEQIQKAFPGYSLPYMTAYSIYGLVGALNK